MEDLILEALAQNPGITPEQLLAALPEDRDRARLRDDTFYLFRRIALNEDQLLPQGISLRELALLLDQLTGLAVCQAGRGAPRRRKEARYV